MVQRPGHLFSKQEIFEAVWPDTAVTDHALTRVVAQLRRVLGDEAREARYIETVPTRGYRWVPAVQTTEPDKRAATVATHQTATPAHPTPTQTLAPIPTPTLTPVPAVASSVSRFVFRGLTLALLLLTALLALALWTARDRPAAASTSVARSAADIRW